MLEVHPQEDGFVVFDTEVGEPVMKFTDRRGADQLIAEVQVMELHADLARWLPDRVPPAY